MATSGNKNKIKPLEKQLLILYRVHMLSRELILTDKAGAIEKLTAIKHSNNDKKWWELVIKIKNHENEFLMCNARLKTRRWANIMTIISFLCEACPTYVEKSWNSGKNPLELFFGVDSFSNKKTVAEKKRSKVKNP